MTRFFAIAVASACLSGCISVNLGPKGPEKSKNVVVTPPPAPFVEKKGFRADGAWQNPKTGTLISYLSTCNEQADPSLEAATDEVISAFGETKTLSQKKLEFNEREALETQAEARVEGVPTKIRALLFKKNGCLYTLTHLGLSKSFDKDTAYFDGFVKGFQAP